MNSYNKIYLEKIAKEKGFVRDNLEKVMRLSEILQSPSPLVWPRLDRQRP